METSYIKRFPDGRILAFSPVVEGKIHPSHPITVELQRRSLVKLIAQFPELQGRTINKDIYGRPVVEGIPAGHFSIAHSGNCAGFMYDPSSPTGLDIELIRPKVLRILDKFLSAAEKEDAMNQSVPEKAIVYWCAKETLYKWYGKKEVHFKTDMAVDPFSYTAEGVLKCRFTDKRFPAEDQRIKYERHGEHMISYISREY